MVGDVAVHAPLDHFKLGPAATFRLGWHRQRRLLEPLARSKDRPQTEDQKDRDPGKNE
jgi:hypothetical protein